MGMLFSLLLLHPTHPVSNPHLARTFFQQLLAVGNLLCAVGVGLYGPVCLLPRLDTQKPLLSFFFEPAAVWSF